MCVFYSHKLDRDVYGYYPRMLAMADLEYSYRSFNVATSGHYSHARGL